MKTYLIICDGQAVADKVNDYITVSSLFTAGETITEPAVKWGRTYTNDERIYNAVCAYIQEGGTGARTFNLRKFKIQNFCVEIDGGKLSVDGYIMTFAELKYTHLRLPRMFQSGTYAQTLAVHLNADKVSSFPARLCEHVIAHGKKCA